MLRIFLGMISTASLAAFSAALAPTTRATPASAQSPLVGTAGGNGPAAGTNSSGRVLSPAVRPGQILPRGSLLNLSV